MLLLAGCSAQSPAPEAAAPPDPTPKAPPLAPDKPDKPAVAAPADSSGCTGDSKLTPGVPGSPGHLIPSEINPNGASELADRMRRMQTDLQGIRAAHLDGKPFAPIAFAEHERIRCSWPTDPNDRNPEYDGMAQSYLALVKAYNANPTPVSYTGVLQGCVACHQNTCPGPVAAIEPLFLPSHPPPKTDSDPLTR